MEIDTTQYVLLYSLYSWPICQSVSVWRFPVGQSVWYSTGHHHLQCARVSGAASLHTGRVRGQLHCHGGGALHLWVSAVNP